MFRKLLLLTIVPISFTSATSLSELLSAVQNTLTRYETDGTAVEKPYIYNKILYYYRYGKLYAADALYNPAVEMLEIAACTAAPVDCSPYKYFIKALHPKTYRCLLKNYPILTARLETAYNAYAEWWIGKQKGLNDFKEFKNLEVVLKTDFYKAWREFFKVAPRPIYFQISKDITLADKFLLNLLKDAYRQGLIKQIIFYGDVNDYRILLHSGLINYRVQFKPYQCPYNDFVVVY